MTLSENVSHLGYTVDNDLISKSALNTDDSEANESMLFHGVLKLSLQPPESAEQTFRWAWCCGNGAQNGHHLRELWCNFIKGVFMQCGDDFCRRLYWFFDMYFLESIEQMLVCLN